jgi:hypothetical protein
MGLWRVLRLSNTLCMDRVVEVLIAPACLKESIASSMNFAPPYRKAIQEGQLLSLMASYSYIDEVSASVSKYLLQNILRGLLGFGVWIR